MSSRFFGAAPDRAWGHGQLYVELEGERVHLTYTNGRQTTLTTLRKSDCEQQVQSGAWVELTMLDVDHLRHQHGLAPLFSAQVSPEAAEPRSDVPVTVAEDAW